MDEDNGSADPSLGTGTSLREAINLANGAPGADTIDFDIPGSGVHTISLLSALPTITDPVIIDGYTQPGASPNTLADRRQRGPAHRAERSQCAGSGVTGLLINAGGSTVEGLVINALRRSTGIAMRQDRVESNGGDDPGQLHRHRRPGTADWAINRRRVHRRLGQ